MRSNPQLSLLILILGAITIQGARPESQQKSGNHVLGECFLTRNYDYTLCCLNFVFTNCRLDITLTIK